MKVNVHGEWVEPKQGRPPPWMSRQFMAAPQGDKQPFALALTSTDHLEQAWANYGPGQCAAR